MKFQRPLILLTSFCILFSCSRETSGTTGWYGNKRKHKPAFRTVSCPSWGGQADQYAAPNGLASNNPYESGGNSAGQITAGELNDLSEWDFWDDIASERLSNYSDKWNLSPTHRAVFVVQSSGGNPIIGATVELFQKEGEGGEAISIWKGRTDNTGTAHLFGRIEKMDSTTEINHAIVSHQGKSERIDKPKMIETGVNNITLDVVCNQSNLVDIAFVVDATGSMQDEIDFLKDDLLDIIEESVAFNPKIDIHLASLFYRCEENSYVTKHRDFSNNLDRIMQFIQEQNAAEGGDEVVAKALNKAIDSLSWRDESRAKLLFIVLDEPPGANAQVTKDMQNAFRKAAEKGIKIIPCVASGTSNQFDRSLEYLMRNAAILTNGTYVFFTNDSGIGDDHTLPIVKSYEVEKLNALLKRIIQSNILVSDCEPTKMPVASTIEEGDNKDSQLQAVMDSIYLLDNDSLRLLALMPYTDFSTYEELEAHRPIANLDTTQLLLDREKKVFSYKIYPNPTLSDITVETSHLAKALYVLDAHGKLLWKIEAPSELRTRIDLSGYPRGNYQVVLLLEEDKKSATIIRM